MDDLVQFLRARLDEDERVARDCSGENWWGHPENWVSCPPLNRVALVAHDGDRTHIVRHGPARVLAEVGAKRRTLVRCQESLLSASPMLVHFAQETLREMALPYADAPD